MAFLNLVLLK